MAAGGLRLRGISILAGLGLAAGLTGGLLGIGGGALVVPGLVFFFNFSQHRAHGTSLAVVVFLSLASVLTYSNYGHMNVLLALEIAFGGVVGALLGARVVRSIPGGTLRLIFCTFLALVGARMFWGGLTGQNHLAATGGLDYATAAGFAAATAVGLGTGFVSGMLGVGGGTVMVPAMVLVLGVPQQTAQGVSLAAMLPTALTGAAVHAAAGNVDTTAGKWVGLGAVVGALAGANAAVRMSPYSLKLAFGVFLMLISLLMALRRR